MKYQIFALTIVGFCLCAAPAWAMNDDDVPLNKATRIRRPVAAPAVAAEEDIDDFQSDTSQSEDETSKTFFVHIGHPDAARLYEHFMKKQFFEGKSDPKTDELVNRDEHMRELCTTMKSALEKFGAGQKLIHTFAGGKIIALTTREEQSVSTVVDHLKKPLLVDQIFLDRSIVSQYRPTISLLSPIEAIATSLANAARRNGRTDVPWELHFEKLLKGNAHPTTDAASSTAQTESSSSAGRDGSE